MYPPQGIIEIDGHLYEWRWNGCICGLYEVEEESERPAGGGRSKERQMWTFEMPINSLIRQAREEIYRRWSTKELEMLHRFACSKTKELRQFGEYWREDYRLWLEDRQAKEAA